MSANKAEISSTKLWLLTPDNARIAFILVLILFLLKLPLTGSLWLDEGVTAWITKDGLVAAIDRATQFQGQSPLYFMIEWGARLLLGSSEFALRFLSLAGVLAAAALVIIVAKRIGGAAYGWIAGAVFLAIDPVQVAAVSARPYGLALFFSIGAMWALILWEEKGKYRYSLLYLFFFLMSVYLQYLFAAMLAVHAVHAALHFKSQRVKFISYVFASLLMAALLFPAFLHMVDMSGNQFVWRFVPRPTVLSAIRAVIPPVLAICAVGALIFGALLGDSRQYSIKMPWRTGTWMGFWYLFPPLFFIAVSLARSSSLFLDRYYLFYAPAVAMAFAAVPFIFKSERTRSVTLVAFAAFLILREADRSWMVENWRAAAAIAKAEDSSVPIVVYSGLAELKEITWLRDEKRREYLTSPLLYYGVKARSWLLPPPDDRKEVNEYFESLMADPAFNSKRVLFIGLDQKLRGQSTVESLAGRFVTKGFTSRELPLGGESSVRVIELNRE